MNLPIAAAPVVPQFKPVIKRDGSGKMCSSGQYQVSGPFGFKHQSGALARLLGGNLLVNVRSSCWICLSGNASSNASASLTLARCAACDFPMVRLPSVRPDACRKNDMVATDTESDEGRPSFGW
ncbi:MAG: hypothetical protein IPH54_21865 [Rhodoferax sp.]|nr:hypothetical protein [Rhodoferax sp.]